MTPPYLSDDHYNETKFALWYNKFDTPQCAALTDCCGCGAKGSPTAFFECPQCRHHSSIIVSIFCSPECFQANWNTHQAWHIRYTPNMQGPTPLASPFRIPQILNDSDSSDDETLRHRSKINRNKALININRGEFRKARKYLSKRSSTSPWKYSVSQDLAHCFEESGHPNKALDLLLEALPRQAYLLFTCGKNDWFFYAISHIHRLAADHSQLRNRLPIWLQNTGLHTALWHCILRYCTRNLGHFKQRLNTVGEILDGVQHYYHMQLDAHAEAQPDILNHMRENAANLHGLIGLAIKEIRRHVDHFEHGPVNWPLFDSALHDILDCIRNAGYLTPPNSNLLWHDDPTHPLRIGRMVRVSGLSKTSQLDGSIGLLCQHHVEPGKCAVQIEGYNDLQHLNHANLTILNYPDDVNMCFIASDPETRYIMSIVAMSASFSRT